MNKGFYTALGTPLDSEGKLIVSSFEKQIEDQIYSGVSGLLVLGSMGMQSAIDVAAYPEIIKTCTRITGKRCPVFAGVMDNSVIRVRDRLEMISDSDADGVVVTAPFYYKETGDDIISFIKAVADISKFPVFIYDLPGVTQSPITFEQVRSLGMHGNIKGIKTGNITLARKIHRQLPDMLVFYSGLDTFDTAYRSGIARNLDGMFSCMPKTTSRMYDALDKGDYDKASAELDKIVCIRDILVKYSIFPSFTAAMNIMGYDGRFHPDYHSNISSEAKEIIKDKIMSYERG